MKLLDRLKLQLGGYVYLGHRKRSGWKAALPFYAFRCPVHGVVESYPAGYYYWLRCPLCKAGNDKVVRVKEPLPDGLDYQVYPSKEHEGL